MKRWFSGKFAGHYRGTPQTASELSLLPQGEHFRVEIYEGLVSEIELGPLEAGAGSGENGVNPDSGPSEAAVEGAGVASMVIEKKAEAKHHHVPIGPSLHQSHIGQVHFIDAVRRGQTIRGTAHDVLLSELHFTHPARHGLASLGRVEGIISGWFRPPSDPEPVTEIEPPPAIAPVGWASDVVPSPGTSRSPGLGRSEPERESRDPSASSMASTAAPQDSLPQMEAPAIERDVQAASESERSSAPEPEKVRPLRDTDERLMPAFPLEGLHAGRNRAEGGGGPLVKDEPLLEDASFLEDDPDEEFEGDFEPHVEAAPPREYPFFTLGACATILLAFLASPFAAALFAVPFLVSYVLRRWLVGIVPDGSFTRFLSLCIGTGTVLLGALTIAHWVTVGCVALSPFSLLVLMGGQFTSSLLPRPLTYAIANGMLVLVLLQAYASWALGPCS